MAEQITRNSTKEVVANIVSDLTESTIVVNPSAEIVNHLVSSLSEVDGPPTVQIIAEEEVLKTVRHNFLTAAQTADLIDTGALQVRTLSIDPGNTLFITSDAGIGILTAGEESVAISTDNSDFISTANQYYSREWAEGMEFNLRTPPLTEIKETLRDEIAEDVKTDLTEALAIAEERDVDVDIVTMCLLVAAKNNALQYDISKWGEDIGLASKATFSRTKTRLEEQGFIRTEKVPIDVGRPRLRLILSEEFSDEPDIDDLVEVAAK